MFAGCINYYRKYVFNLVNLNHFQENENYDETNTECQYTLTDPDGYLNIITISIVVINFNNLTNNRYLFIYF